MGRDSAAVGSDHEGFETERAGTEEILFVSGGQTSIEAARDSQPFSCEELILATNHHVPESSDTSGVGKNGIETRRRRAIGHGDIRGRRSLGNLGLKEVEPVEN